jgi:hypothetical protein
MVAPKPVSPSSATAAARAEGDATPAEGATPADDATPACVATPADDAGRLAPVDPQAEITESTATDDKGSAIAIQLRRECDRKRNSSPTSVPDKTAGTLLEETADG